MLSKIKVIIEKDTFSKDYIINNYSKKFYGYLKSTNSIFFVNNNIVQLDVQLKKSDVYEIHYYNKEKQTVKINKEIDILYEDDYLIILDKETNLLTIPSINEQDSLYSRLIFHRENDSINILTRLDKLTKGIVVVAKKHYLVNKINIIKKEYTAKTDNYLPNDEGIINLPILKTDSMKRIIDNRGKESITNYKLYNKEKHLYKLTLQTGRTHQIRVHLAHYNCPINGDSLYGSNIQSDLMLVCSSVELIHPITNKLIKIISNYTLE